MRERLDRHYRLIVFDWDGTLRDSVASIVDCGTAALADAGFDQEASDQKASDGKDGDQEDRGLPDRIRSTIGLALADAVPMWQPGIDGAGIATVLARYRYHWLDRFHAVSSLFPEVPGLLAALESRGHLLAVATGKSRVGLERDLTQAASVRSFFAATRTADESAVKPSPVMLLQLMEELGCAAQETLMVGDTTHDLLMAQNASVDAIGVVCGAMGRAELEPHCLAVLERTAMVQDLLR